MCALLVFDVWMISVKIKCKVLPLSLIPLYFRKPGPEECGQFFPTSLVLKYIGDSIGSKLNVVKVGMAMKNLGFKSKRNLGLNGWVCMPINPQEMADYRKRMAMHADDEEE
jgi:hypothetical protein